MGVHGLPEARVENDSHGSACEANIPKGALEVRSRLPGVVHSRGYPGVAWPLSTRIRLYPGVGLGIMERSFVQKRGLKLSRADGLRSASLKAPIAAATSGVF